MVKRLFDCVNPSAPLPKTSISPLFALLQYSDTDEAQSLRQTLERWFLGYPEDHKAEMKARILDPSNHHAGIFELCFHELLCRLGYQITVHPDLPGSSHHPDFLCYLDGAPAVYVELYQRWRPENKQKEHHQIDILTGYINKEFGSGDFLILFRFVKNGKPPTSWKVLKFLKDFMGKYDADKLETSILKDSILPECNYKEDNCEITFWLCPRNKEQRGKPDNVVLASVSIRASLPSLSKPIREVLLDKLDAYRISNLPLILVLDVQDPTIGTDSIWDVLFGDRILCRGDIRYSRQRNGLFTRPEVSAVIVVREFDLRSIGSVQVHLIHNPWACKPYKGPLCALRQVIASSDGLRSVPGSTLSALLTLGGPEPGGISTPKA